MTVEAKFTTAGMTKGKRYDVIEERKSVNGYKIVLDDGTVAVRHKCGFDIVDNAEEKGWTITYYPWEDMEGKPRVVGRFKTTKEKDEFLEKIYKPDSGWMEEELMTLGIHNDYNYVLPR